MLAMSMKLAGNSMLSLAAGNGYAALLQRLAHHLQHRALKLGQLIQKQHPVVGQGNFARLRIAAAACQIQKFLRIRRTCFITYCDPLRRSF